MIHEIASPGREAVLIVLQVCQVLFLAIHDWVPLGRMNDVSAVRSQDTRARLLSVTALQTLPFAFGLGSSLFYFRELFPHWLYQWLLISYLILLVGQLRAWWLPYLFRPEPLRAERYKVMFGKTHSFLPLKNGMVPNTAHVLLHIATVATLCCLLIK